MSHQPQRKPLHASVVLFALVGAVALSGCTGLPFDDSGHVPTNEAPAAHLAVASAAGWTGEPLIFDAQNSTDPDGHVTQWSFDFGDGNTSTVKDRDDARVEHTYRQAGVYTVTLTVTDDGANNTGALTDTSSKSVTVHGSGSVAGSVATSGANLTDSFQTSSTSFEARNHVERFELEVDVQSALVAGSTEVDIHVVDSANQTIAQDTVVVGAGENQTILLDEALVQPGTYRIDVTAESGAATFEGEWRTYYVGAEDESE